MGEVNDLPKLIIILIVTGLIIAIGLVVLDRFSDTFKLDTSFGNENVSNGSVTLANVPVRSVSSVYSLGNESVTTYVLSGNVLTTTSAKDWFLVNYTYGADTRSSVAGDNTITSIAGISSDWMPIIVIVLIVGVVLTMILGAFAFYGRRQ
jgi:hypothetical protein